MTIIVSMTLVESPKTTLLIVDDEPAVVEVLGGYLQTRGYEVRGVGRAAEVLDLYQQWKPVLVLLDVLLPDGSGLDVLRTLKTANPDAKIVVITAVQDYSLRQEAMAAGASGFAFKPVQVTALDRILRTAAGLAPFGPHGKRPCVMILDDEAEIRVGLKYYLIGQGMDVIIASTAEEGLSLLRAMRPSPQVLVLDLDLPHLSGVEFLKLVRQMWPELAVIILTGLGGSTPRTTTARLGAQRFLHKPVTLKILERTIRELLPTPAASS